MNLKSLKLKDFKSQSTRFEKILLVTSLESLKNPKKWESILGVGLRARLSMMLDRQRSELKAGFVAHSTASQLQEPDLHVAAVDPKMSVFEMLEFFRTQLKLSLQTETRSFGVIVLGLESLEKNLADGFGAALAARLAQMPMYGKRLKDQKKFEINEIYFFGSQNLQKFLDYGFESGEASNRVRSWGMTPPNELNPETFGQKIKGICQDLGFSLKFYSKSELRKMGAGAFTAVDQGDPDSKGGIYEITYSPKKAKNKKPVALVGKGLCFDTGGYDVKTFPHMTGMKGDMQGAAVALSCLMSLARLKIPIKVKAFLGITENHISPKSYKPDEVVVSLNGTSIEIVNTDAEGRMVLADVLTIASRAKPDLIMDFATLTGTAVYSIGKNYAAAFTNQEKWHSLMIECGKRSGERVWPFPMDKDYNKALESTIADTLQCSKASGVDHILAAIFLQKFIENEIPWIHIDLAAAEKAGGLAHVDTEFTGFGPRWALEFLSQKYRLTATLKN
jgi:leucyl aminopeptidase